MLYQFIILFDSYVSKVLARCMHAVLNDGHRIN